MPEQSSGNGGVGLTNVKRRLELCYGADAEVVMQADQTQTTVGFRIPLRRESSRVKRFGEVTAH